MEERCTCNINLDLEPKGELETNQSHVILRQESVTENEKVKLPVSRSADSLALLSVHRYADRIKEFLGWESFRENSDDEDKSRIPRLTEDEKCCSVDSLKRKINLIEESKDSDCIEDISILGNISENYNSEKEIFSSEINLSEEDSKAEKAILHNNLEAGDFITNNNKNMDMDKVILENNETSDSGLMLNDEHLIMKNEHEKISPENDKKNIGNNEKETQEIISESVMKADIGNSQQNDKIDNNTDINESPEQNTEILSGVKNEDTEYKLNDQFIPETEQKESTPEKTEKITELPNGDLSQKTIALNLYNESDVADKNKNLIKNNMKENNKNNVIGTPLKAHVQCTNKLSKTTLCKETKNNEKQKLEDYDESTTCGIGIFKPRWLQRFATAKVYVVLYSVIGILHGSYYSYLIGTLSTLEKRFAFKSKTSGTIMITDEITPLLLGMIVGYYATKAHRPRIVALGMILSAGCCFVTSLPYFIYGPAQNLVFSVKKSDAGPEHCDPNIEAELCDPDRPQNLLAVICLMFGSFLKGFGNLAYYAIGLVYLDDNSDKQSSPIYFGK